MSENIVFHISQPILEEFIVKELVKIVHISNRDYSNVVIDICSISDQKAIWLMDYFCREFSNYEKIITPQIGANKKQVVFISGRVKINFLTSAPDLLRGRTAANYLFILGFDQLSPGTMFDFSSTFPHNHNTYIIYHVVMNQFYRKMLDPATQLNFNVYGEVDLAEELPTVVDNPLPATT